MADRNPIYSVTVDANGVALGRIDPKDRRYGKAAKGAILRQRDAIELFRKMKASRRRFNGVYCFHFLDSARTFALLRLQMLEGEVQDNFDRILAFDGGEKARRS